MVARIEATTILQRTPLGKVLRNHGTPDCINLVFNWLMVVMFTFLRASADLTPMPFNLIVLPLLIRVLIVE